ncbi:MAG: NAD(P)/FAD-dependent oxidoreductase [Gemmatimonas sp.]|uniref:NAD(P)/FAD-dependent oxidoreductase n=1 Tax=Gemmatimonas sp. TaxID=1962908 RepID=UPI00391F504E|nr:FAD-binding oxidoreductase [Gemmatimonadota bacterium]
MTGSLLADTAPVWDDGRWTPLPTLHGDVSADAVVIGLGGSGLTLIEELLRRDERVIGIDAHDVAAGAAGRNGGFLLAGAYDFYHDAVRRYGRERARAIYAATLEEIPRIAEAAPGTVRPVGSKRIAANAAEIRDCREQLAMMQADGLPAEWYEGTDGVGLFIPTDGAFDPLTRCRMLAARARRDGATLFAKTRVDAIEGTRVLTPHGVIHAGRVFVAVDGKLETVLPELVGRVRTARLQMLACAPTAEVRIPCPVYYRGGYEYWQQLPDGRIALGGLRDHGGMEEWSLEPKPTATVQSALEAFLRSHIKVSAPVTHRWAACAAYTETGLPILEQVREHVWALGGYSGTGNVIGALCARAAVSAALDGDSAPAQRLFGQSWSAKVTHGGWLAQ